MFLAMLLGGLTLKNRDGIIGHIKLDKEELARKAAILALKENPFLYYNINGRRLLLGQINYLKELNYYHNF